ncbi:MAG: polyprenol monophosphomannose synthase [Bacteroidales bacterium]
MSDTLVIIPTYNEKENIEKIIRKVFSLSKPFDILVVEDHSPDGTASIVRKLMQEYPERLFMEEREGKLGLGTAYIHGFKWALQRKYLFVIEMDADFSHNPNDLERLYNACTKEGADLSIGSRYVNGVVNVVNWPIGRVLMSYYASAYVRFVTGMKIGDTTAGFVCYRASLLRALDLDAVKFVGYAFQIEMKCTAFRLGYNIKEVSIVFTDRKEGTSKMSKKIFKEAFFGVISLRFRKFKGVPKGGETFVK